MSATTDPGARVTPTATGFVWLWRLRWVAVASQALAVGVSARWLPVPLDLPVLTACVGFTATSNLAILALRRWWGRAGVRACAALLALDTVALTLMLGAAGGAHNPFTSFYLLHVALAALLLPMRWMMVVMGLTATGFSFLYAGGPEWCGLDVATGGIPADLHFQGMFVALGATSASIAYFVGRLQADLRRLEAAELGNRLRLARQERFAGLATLAAGVAHELATPLSTVAVVSRELERTACTQCLNGACRDDARLIRAEVDRCRAILDRLDAESTDEHGDAHDPIPLGGLAAELASHLSAAHGARLRVTVGGAEAELRVPRAALLQALAVMIKNACEADGSGAVVRLAVRTEAGFWCFRVEDQGPGFPEAALERVGEPYFTTKPVGEGRGLGLYIVRMFAERLGGDVRFWSGSGGAVELRFPVRRGGAHG